MTTAMDPRKNLYAFAMKGKEHSPAVSDRASGKIDAFRAAVLREVAAEILGIDAHPNASGHHSDIYKALAHRFRRQADELEKPEVSDV